MIAPTFGFGLTRRDECPYECCNDSCNSELIFCNAHSYPPADLAFCAIVGVQASKLNHHPKETNATNQPRANDRSSPRSLERLRRGLCHHRDLVGAIALSILFKSLLRPVVTKFLSICCRLHCHYAFRVLSASAWRPSPRSSRYCSLFLAVPA